MRITLVCENCGNILVQEDISPEEVIKAVDVPYRIKMPVCPLCAKIKKAWKKK